MRASVLFAVAIALLFGLGVVIAAKYTGFFEPAPMLKQIRPKVLVARTNLFEGTTVLPDFVMVRDLAPEEEADYNRNRRDYMPPVVAAAANRILIRNVPADQPLKKEYFQDLALPKSITGRLKEGMVAVHLTLPPDRAGGGLMQVGEYVDVYLTTQICQDKNCYKSYTATGQLARNLRIIAKRNNLWVVMQPIKENEPVHYTLEANPYRAALISYAANTAGQLSLVPTVAPKTVPVKGFSDPNSKEYRDEDERVAKFNRGELTVGADDLKRIFDLPLPNPDELPLRVEHYRGLNMSGTTVFQKSGAFSNITSRGKQGTFMLPNSPWKRHEEHVEGSSSVHSSGYSDTEGRYWFRPPGKK